MSESLDNLELLQQFRLRAIDEIMKQKRQIFNLKKKLIRAQKGNIRLINTLEIATLIVIASDTRIPKELYKPICEELSDKVFEKARKAFFCKEHDLIVCNRVTENDKK